jgi:hypothetical protein
VILLSENTSIPNIQSMFKHMCSCLYLIAWLSLAHIKLVRAREYLTAQRWPTTRLCSFHQPLHRLQLHTAATQCIIMFDDAPVGGNDATHFCSGSVSYTLSLSLAPPFVFHRDASRNTFTSLFRISCVIILSLQYNSSRCWQ